MIHQYPLISFLRKNYIGYLFKKNKFPEIQLLEDNFHMYSINDFNKKYVSAFKDKHLVYFSKNEKQEIKIHLRSIENKLMILEDVDDELKKGMLISNIGEFDITFHLNQMRLENIEVGEEDLYWNKLLWKSIKFECNGTIYNFRNINNNCPTIYTKLINNILLVTINSFFDGDAIAAQINQIKSKYENCKYWIIDIRNNKGGADTSYLSLVPHLFNRKSKIKMFIHKHLLTNQIILERIKVLESLKSKSNHEYFEKMITELSHQAKEKELNIIRDYNQTGEHEIEGTLLPEKIIVLQDVNCGSSGEIFLLLSKYSDKVITVGRNTRGVVDFGNCVMFNFDEYNLLCPTSMASYLSEGICYDDEGIPPDYYIPWDKDFLEIDKDIAFAIKLLNT